jgi:hypothetical protein
VAYKEIELTNGGIAIVDDEDYEELLKYKWHKKIDGYAARTVYEKGKFQTIRMHREIMDAPKGFDVDHVNGNRLDNRKTNLRKATRSQNVMNKGKLSNNKSGYKGVYWDSQTKKWRACIRVNGKLINLGRFQDKDEAALEYNKAAIFYHKEFAFLNEVKNER